MSPLSLIPAPYRAAAVAGLLAACVGLGFAGGWAVNGWRLGTELQADKARHAQAVAKGLSDAIAQRDAAIKERDAKAAQLAAIDADASETLRRFNRANDSLRPGVAAGTVRVRVHGAECPRPADVPQAPARGGVDSGTGAVLAPETGSAVLDLRADAERVARKLDACQRSLGCITGQLACPASPP